MTLISIYDSNWWTLKNNEKYKCRLNIASHYQLSKQEKKYEELIFCKWEYKNKTRKKSFDFIYSTTDERIYFIFESNVFLFLVKSAETKDKRIHWLLFIHQIPKWLNNLNVIFLNQGDSKSFWRWLLKQVTLLFSESF